MTEYQTSDLEETESIDEIFGGKKVSSGPAQHSLGGMPYKRQAHADLMKKKHGVETKFHGGVSGDELSYHGPVKKVKAALATHYGGDHDEAKFNHPHIYGAKKESLNYTGEEDIMEMNGSDEEASVKSADAASDASGSAPKRKGDNTTQDPMPKTKAALMAGMMAKLQKMDKKSLQAMYKMEGVEVDEDGEVISEAPKADVTYEANFEEDLNALVAEEATLSDEFKAKAETIFEAAIKSKLSNEIDRLEEKYNEELSEEIATTKADLVEKVDSYLNYVVEQWMEDNKVAVQAGLRTEIAEKFMNSLKDLFVESYIDVPESKVDLVDELAEEVDELETKLNESTGKIIEMTEELENFKRNEVIREASKDLAETQIEKLKNLVADIDFSDDFAKKVATVKESYFNKPATTEVVTEEDETFEVESSDVMGKYLSAIKKQNKS